jgi:hypothetical protein
MTDPLTIDALERWVLFGAEWRLAHLSDDRAVVELFTCTGELVERRESHDPALIDYLRSAQTNLAVNREKEETR